MMWEEWALLHARHQTLSASLSKYMPWYWMDLWPTDLVLSVLGAENGHPGSWTNSSFTDAVSWKQLVLCSDNCSFHCFCMFLWRDINCFSISTWKIQTLHTHASYGMFFSTPYYMLFIVSYCDESTCVRQTLGNQRSCLQFQLALQSWRNNSRLLRNILRRFGVFFCL